MRVTEALPELKKLGRASNGWLPDKKVLEILDAVWLEAYEEGKAGLFDA